MNDVLLCGILNKDDPLKVTDALLLALIGIVVVFVVLILLMLIVSVVGKIFEGSNKLKAKHPEWNDKMQNFQNKLMFWKKTKKDDDVAADEEAPALANGTCGELKLVNTTERDAAMIMAIVADATQTPLNELRFKSIKRVDAEGEEK